MCKIKLKLNRFRISMRSKLIIRVQAVWLIGMREEMLLKIKARMDMAMVMGLFMGISMKNLFKIRYRGLMILWLRERFIQGKRHILVNSQISNQ